MPARTKTEVRALVAAPELGTACSSTPSFLVEALHGYEEAEHGAAEGRREPIRVVGGP